MDTPSTGRVTALTPILSGLTLARALVLLAVICMAVSAVGYLPQNDNLILPTLLMLAGGGALLGALWLRRDWGIPPLPVGLRAGSEQRVRWLPLLAGIMLLALLGVRGAIWGVSIEIYQRTPVHVQVLMLLAGIVLLVVGAGGLGRADVIRWRAGVIAHRHELALIAAIMLVAFAVRMYHLGDGVRAFMDEGPFLHAMVAMRENPLLPLTAPMDPTASSTRLFAFLQMVLSDIFGSSIAVFRTAGVLFGVLTVGATYGLARWLFDRRTALIAGVLLAVFPPHIQMSRIAIYNITDPLFGVLALACFTRAVQTQRRIYYVLAGMMLGLLPYVYEAGELLFPPLVLLWAILLAAKRQTRPSWRGAGWMLITALILALPVYYTTASFHLPLFSRLDDAGVGRSYVVDLLMSPNGLAQLGEFLRQHLLPPLLHYAHAPDASLFYGGQTALILPWLVPVFLLGLFHALRRTSGALLVMWALLTALGNSLILYNNWTARFVVAMPVVALLCAVGLRYTLPIFNIRRGWVIKAFLVAASVAQLTYYFGPHLTYYNHQILMLRRHYDVVYRTMLLPPDTIVYFNYEDSVQIPFYYDLLKYVGDPHEFHAESFANYDFSNLDPEKHYGFFVNPLDKAALAKLETLWILDGPYYDESGDLTQVQQFGLYLATPMLRRDGAARSG